MIVSEVFGPTVQGEGPSIGRRAGFVRLGRCDLHCSWCDTPYTWDWSGRNGVIYDPKKELNDIAVAEIIRLVEAFGVRLVVITGGEPFVQPHALAELVEKLYGAGFDIEVETNGRHAPSPEVVKYVEAFNVSPKLPNSGQPLELTWVPRAITAFRDTHKARFKFVCCDIFDVERVAELCEKLDIPPFAVWVMPEGQDPDAVRRHLREIAEVAIGSGFNITGRLHVDIWGGVRGH